MEQLPRIALLGRPNVGKSTLFNRLIGSRQAVVADIAGTTRDRLERTISVAGRDCIITDMAGLEPVITHASEIKEGMHRQVMVALEHADVVLWVVDAIEGVTPADQLVAELLRRFGKPVVVAANKCDHSKHEFGAFEFAEYGFSAICPISAMHDRGITELETALLEVLPETGTKAVKNERELILALTGRPNVGKSTLLNSLVGEERSVVSAEAGTTRDAVDTVLPAGNLFGNIFTRWQTIRIVDTAGIRRRGKIDRSIEGWSVLRSYAAIDAADVTLLLIDAVEGLVHQDTQVIDRVTAAGKPFVLLINKWDAVLATLGIEAGSDADMEKQERFLTDLRFKLVFVHWVQVLFLSATTGLNVSVVGRLVNEAYNAWSREIPASELDVLAAELRKMPRLNNLQKITLEHSRPPTFHLDIHGRVVPHFSTRRFVENALRDYFELGPTPIKIWVNLTGPQAKRHLGS